MDYLIIICSFLVGVFVGGVWMTGRAKIVIDTLLKSRAKREKEYKTYLKELGNNS
jgi:hypothetical protein